MESGGARIAPQSLLKFVIDMNLSPQWTGVFRQNGLDAVHWSELGDGRAPDSEIMEYARRENCVVFTPDLDFSALLFHTQATSPSVIQIRSEDTRPSTMSTVVLAAITTTEKALEQGALLTIDPRKQRLHLLPLGSSSEK